MCVGMWDELVGKQMTCEDLVSRFGYVEDYVRRLLQRLFVDCEKSFFAELGQFQTYIWVLGLFDRHGWGLPLD